MKREDLYQILQSISIELNGADPEVPVLPPSPDWSASLETLGIDLLNAQDYFTRLESRIPSKAFKVPAGLGERLQGFANLGELADHLMEKGFGRPSPKEVVYVDDEPENIFIFKRRFGKHLRLKTFEDPAQALEYIIRSPDVGLVVTDEVMPGMGGNQLCDATHKVKPGMKFILITGNPNSDEELMYRSLRKGRFYEFINKPVDFEGKGEEYLSMMQGLLAFDW